MQLGMHVLNTCTHIFKTPDVRVIMGMQDMRASGAFNAYKACGQMATLRLHCCADTIDHSQGITTVLGDSTGKCHTTD
jgi:hypothetical protein